MKIKVKANVLAEALGRVMPALSGLSASLKGKSVLLEAFGGQISFGVENLVGTLKSFVGEEPTNIIEEGSVFVGAKELFALLNSFGKDTLEIFDPDPNNCVIQSPTSNYKISKIISDFPVIKIKDIDSKSVSYNLPVLQNLFLMLRNYIAPMETPTLNGVYMGRGYMVSCNRYQGAMVKTDGDFDDLEGIVFNEPILDLILNMKDSLSINLLTTESSIYGATNNLYFEIVKNEGEYPIDGVMKIFKKKDENVNAIKIDKQKFSESLQRLLVLSSAFKRDEVQLVNMSQDKKAIVLENFTSNSSGQEVLNCESYEQEGFSLGFDGSLVLNSLKHFAGLLTFKIGESTPIFIHDNNLMHFIAGVKSVNREKDQ